MTEKAGNVKAGNAQSSKTDRGRGIGYPFISLEQAVARAKQLWSKEGKNLAYVSAAVKHWGFGGESGPARQTVAALKAYGLIQDEGAAESRQIRLTERALDILLEPDLAKRRRSLQEAVFLPRVHKELLSKWSPADLPSDQTIEAHLLRKMDFNRKTVTNYIKNFRSDISFTGLAEPVDTPSKSPYVPCAPNDSDLTGGPDSAGMAPHSGFVSPTKVAPNGSRQDTFSLDEGVAILQLPTTLSEASFEDFESWIKLQLKKIKRSVAN